MKKTFKISLFSNFIICLVFTVGLIAIRTYQILNFMDLRTGFYKGPDYLNYCFFGGICLLALVLAFSSYFADGIDVCVPISNKILGFGSIVFAVFFVFYLVIFAMRDNSTSGYESTNSEVPTLLLIGNIVLIVGFLYFAYKFRQSEGSPADVLLLLPAAWVIFRFVGMLLNHMAMFSTQENVLNVLKTCSICVFLFYMGRFLAGFSSRVANVKMLFSGCLSACLIFCSALPRYIFSFSRGFSRKYYLNVSDLVTLDFVLAIFVVIFLVFYFAKLKKSD